MSLTDKCFSLDIDATLVSTSSEMGVLRDLRLYTDSTRAHLRDRIYHLDMADVCETPGTGVRTRMWGVYRPHLFEFLDFLNWYCSGVVIWSAGQSKYVSALSNLLFPTQKNQPTLIYDHDDCVYVGTQMLKPLTKLYADPRSEGIYTEMKTYHLDDRDDVCLKNPRNGIKIPEYDPAFTPEGIVKDDIALIQLMYWLMLPEVLATTDIRMLDKSKIFTTPLTKYHAFFGKIPWTIPTANVDVESMPDNFKQLRLIAA